MMHPRQFLLSTLYRQLSRSYVLLDKYALNKLQSNFLAVTRLLTIVATIAIFVIMPQAQAITQAEFNSIVTSPYYDPGSAICDISPTSATGGARAGSKLFFIGDSLTVGAIRARLLAKSSAASYEVDERYTSENIKVDGASYARVKGKSVEATEGFRIGRTITNLKQHEADFSTGSADIIVIALGTNHESDMLVNAAELVTYLRSVNANLNNKSSIMWINTNYTDTSLTPSSTVNKEIESAAIQSNFTVLDIASTGPAPNNGGIHYNSSGYEARSDKILELIGGVVQAPVAGGDATPAATDNYAVAWSYLVSTMGLSENAAAGIMGNLEAESGINPKNMQRKKPDAPPDDIKREEPQLPTETGKENVVNHSIYGARGYGIVQWTTRSRQDNFLSFSLGNGPAPFNTKRTNGDLLYQLDYMKYELESGFFNRANNVVRNPNVSINDAADIIALYYETPGGVIIPRPHPDKTEAENKTIIQNATKSRESVLNLRRQKASSILQRFAGTVGTPGTPSTAPGGGCGGAADSPSTDLAKEYIPDCSINNGNAAIACTAIDQLINIPYNVEKRAAATDPSPEFLDCSAFTGMAVYRTFGVDLSGMCSIEYRSNDNFEEIDVHSIQPGDLVGLGTSCGPEGHIGIVVSYDSATKKLITVEESSDKSGLRGIGGQGGYNVGLEADGFTEFPYQWAVRYIGPKNAN